MGTPTVATVTAGTCTQRWTGELVSQLFDAVTNARFYAWTRFALGLLALTKGMELLYVGVAPGAVVPWMACAALFAAGLAPLVTGAVLAGLGFLLLQAEYNNHFYSLLLIAGLVTLSQSRAAFAFFATRQIDAPAWPSTLMKVQVSTIYFYAGVAKLNHEWLSGDVLALHFGTSLFRPPQADWFTFPLALAVPAVELFVAAALWRNRLRTAAFALLLPLHAGMLLLSWTLLGIYGIGVFAPLTFLLVQAFAIPRGTQLVVWDDNCVLCGRWVNAFRRLDAFGGLRFVGSSSPEAFEGTGISPAAAADAMQFVSADGTVHSGFAAVRRIVHTLPLGFLISPWFALPMVPKLGDRAYAAVASRRDCRLETEPATVAVIARGSADADNSSRGD